MRWLVLLVVWLAVAPRAYAEPGGATTHGVVVDADTGAPIEAASVLPAHGAATVTGEDGGFDVALPEVVREVTVIAPGYAMRKVKVTRGGDLRIELHAEHAGEVIEVVGKAPEDTKPLAQELTAEEIRHLPGSGNDILRAVQSLPGVARVPYSFGGLILRGMSPRDSTVFLDGIEVPIAFHFGGVTSFYPAGMLDSVKLVSSGFDVSRGRTEGGIVELTTRAPRTDHWRVGGEVGLLHSSVQAEGPLPKHGGIILGVRRSYIDAIVKPFARPGTPLPSYLDAQVRASWGDPVHGGRYVPMLFGSLDQISGDEATATMTFLRTGMQYQRQLGDVLLTATPWAGITALVFHGESTTDEDGNSNMDGSTYRRPSYPMGVRADVERRYPWGALRAGIDVSGGWLSHSELDFDDPDLDGAADMLHKSSAYGWVNGGAWVEARYAWGTLDDGQRGRYSIKPGIRVDGYGVSREAVLDVRLNAHQQLAPQLTLRESIGRFHQPPNPSDVDPVDGTPRLDSSYVDQMTLEVEATMPEDCSLTVTGYRHDGHDLSVLVTDPDGESLRDQYTGLGPIFLELLDRQLGFPGFRVNAGELRNTGVEVALRRNRGNWFGMLAYTLARAERLDDTRYTPADNIGWHPYIMDQTHHVTALGSYRFTNWRLGARVSVVSGNPWSPVIVEGDFEDVVDPFGARLPTFYSVDLRADRTWKKSWGEINFYIDVQNATNHANVEDREGTRDDYDDLPGLPILPFIGVELIPTV